MTGTLDTTSSHIAMTSWVLRPPIPNKGSRNMRCNATCSGHPRASPDHVPDGALQEQDMVIVRGYIMRHLLYTVIAVYPQPSTGHSMIQRRGEVI